MLRRETEGASTEVNSSRRDSPPTVQLPPAHDSLPHTPTHTHTYLGLTLVSFRTLVSTRWTVTHVLRVTNLPKGSMTSILYSSTRCCE
ncbi:hypothetical protein E2C01_014187 [Portunus trituberculatus]|uniref:Uncharacterized protein n=1 Tax=Portunus trituberculatus TaxID=210409 RepID=A0A5B7DII4_PORTR|nr:hypothetical protein [Portunus trituberculatus]